MIAAYRWTHSPSWLAWSDGRQPLDAVLLSADKLGELLQNDLQGGPKKRTPDLFLL